MPAFPSVEWFNAVRDVFNRDEQYHGGGAGACNAEVGIKVGDALFQLSFEGRDCAGATTIESAQLRELDFYLDMEPAAWQAMIENIKTYGHASLDYTLNTLDLDRDAGLCQSATGDQYRADMFFRFNQTFQNYFDASTHIDTSFS